MGKKKKAEAEKENGERWLVSYSDFVTLLLGVFIIMYSMAAAEAQSSGADGSKQESAISALATAFGNTLIADLLAGDSVLESFAGDSLMELEEMAMQEIKEEIEMISGVPEGAIEVTIDEMGVHIKIKDTVLFNSGSPDLNAAAKPILLKIGNALKKVPNNYIQIEGHTDDVPMGGNKLYLETNWELGSLRAVRVLRTLVNSCALNPKFLNATTYGEFRPLVDSPTAEARSQNRRVEITVLRNYLDLSASND